MSDINEVLSSEEWGFFQVFGYGTKLQELEQSDISRIIQSRQIDWAKLGQTLNDIEHQKKFSTKCLNLVKSVFSFIGSFFFHPIRTFKQTKKNLRWRKILRTVNSNPQLLGEILADLGKRGKIYKELGLLGAAGSHHIGHVGYSDVETGKIVVDRKRYPYLTDWKDPEDVVNHPEDWTHPNDPVNPVFADINCDVIPTDWWGPKTKNNHSPLISVKNNEKTIIIDGNDKESWNFSNVDRSFLDRTGPTGLKVPA